MVEEGKTAIVHYTARLIDGPEEGEIVDTTDVDVALETGVYEGHRNYEPLSFEVGAGEVLPGLEEVITTMDRGEERRVVLEPEQTFGHPSEEDVVSVPREEIENRSNTEAAVGELVLTDTEDSGWITAVDEDSVTIDFNHELAGERLEFEIRVIDVR